MSRPDAWMPLYIGDYLADTMHLSTVQHGAYILLLMAYWRAGTPLPDNDAKLAGIARMNPKDWRANRPTIAEFFQAGDGVWRHKRVDAELASAATNQDRRSEAARTAAEARWQRERDAQRMRDASQSQSKSTADGMRGECPSPSPSPSSESSIEDSAARAPPDVASLLFGQGAVWLSSNTGRPLEAAKRLIGKWRSDYGDEALVVVLGKAQRESPIDAIGWIERTLKHRGPYGRTDQGAAGSKPTANETARAGLAAGVLGGS